MLLLKTCQCQALTSYRDHVADTRLSGFIALIKTSGGSSSNCNITKKSTKLRSHHHPNLSTCLVTCTLFMLITSALSSPIQRLSSTSSSRFNSTSKLTLSSVAGASLAQNSSYQLQNIPVLETGSSLSIVSPLDVLRQNMVIEIIRRKHRQSKQRQLLLNKEILDRIG